MEQKLTLGGGCFWCLEAYYQRVNGVSNVVSGYAGGHTEHPTDQDVYRGDTGHAEVVQLTFDPEVVSLWELLEIFFVMHDPTTLNRQGHDVGDEYRSVVFYENDEQKQTVEKVIASFAQPLWPDPIVTQVEPLDVFWPAPNYHQNYYNTNPSAGYCMIVIDPKIQKLRQKFAQKLKP